MLAGSGIGRLWQDLLDETWPVGWQRGGYARSQSPAINAWASEDKLMLTAELPGVKSGDLEISIEGRTLTLKGTYPTEEHGYVRRERPRGEFRRTLTLPFDVNRDAVEAKLTDGVLALALPRREEDKPRKIEIRAE